MGLSIGFGVGPIRYRARLGGRRRRHSSDASTIMVVGYLIVGAFFVAIALLGFAIFLVAISCAPVIGAVAGFFANPRSPAETAKHYARATFGYFASAVGHKKTVERPRGTEQSDPRETKETANHLSNQLEMVELPDEGRVAVVGESHYQDALKTAVGGRAAGYDFHEHIPVVAALVPEPGNEFDRNAVRVDVLADGQALTVGYLSREAAPEYQPGLLELRRSGRLGVCGARVTGGGPKFYGIYLHLAWPEYFGTAIGSEDPVVAVQDERTALLRNDRCCTVTKEENHQETLQRFAPRNGDEFREIVATLGFCTIVSGKHRGQEAIEVQLDGHRVGQLTRLMTERYEQVVRDLMDRGLQVSCEGWTTNTPKGVQVEIRLPDPRRIGLRRES